MPAYTFLVVAALTGGLALLALLQMGWLRFDSGLGRRSDGSPAGRQAPDWRLADTTGMVRQVPNGERSQALVFADHSIVEFPDLVVGLKRLSAIEPEREVLVMGRGSIELVEPAMRWVGLTMPVVGVSREFYVRHNVWVVPFLVFLDRAGGVQANGLANDGESLFHLWRMATGTRLEDLEQRPHSVASRA